MDGSIIGIKLADGSFYPILDESSKSAKQLVLTTVKDDQSNVKIDLYRSSEDQALMDDAEEEYIGSLHVENLPEAPKGEAEIKLTISIDDEAHLLAEAVDSSSGESQSLSVSLESSAEGSSFDVPDFELGQEEPDFESFGEESFGDFPESEAFSAGVEPFPGEDDFDYEEPAVPARYNPLLLAVFIILGLLLIAVVGYVIFRLIQGPEVPPLIGALGKVKTGAVIFLSLPCSFFGHRKLK